MAFGRKIEPSPLTGVFDILPKVLLYCIVLADLLFDLLQRFYLLLGACLWFIEMVSNKLCLIKMLLWRYGNMEMWKYGNMDIRGNGDMDL